MLLSLVGSRSEFFVVGSVSVFLSRLRSGRSQLGSAALPVVLGPLAGREGALGPLEGRAGGEHGTDLGSIPFSGPEAPDLKL